MLGTASLRGSCSDRGVRLLWPKLARPAAPVRHQRVERPGCGSRNRLTGGSSGDTAEVPCDIAGVQFRPVTVPRRATRCIDIVPPAVFFARARAAPARPLDRWSRVAARSAATSGAPALHENCRHQMTMGGAGRGRTGRDASSSGCPCRPSAERARRVVGIALRIGTGRRTGPAVRTSKSSSRTTKVPGEVSISRAVPRLEVEVVGAGERPEQARRAAAWMGTAWARRGSSDVTRVAHGEVADCAVVPRTRRRAGTRRRSEPARRSSSTGPAVRRGTSRAAPRSRGSATPAAATRAG